MTDQLTPQSPKKHTFSFWAIALTTLIIVINISVYFYQLAFASPLPAQEDNLLLFGANVYQLSLTGDWWRYPISMVLHSGLLHLGLNCLAIFVIGIECERAYGKCRMLVIYLFSGIGAAFFSAYWQYNDTLNKALESTAYLPLTNMLTTSSTVYITVGVGASGAVMGLAAAAVIYFGKQINNPELSAEYRQQLKRPLYNILAMIGLTLVNGLQSGIDNAAHIGGAILGAIVSLAFVLAPHSTPLMKKLSTTVVTAVAAIVLVVVLHQMSFSENEDLLYERQFIYQEMNKELNLHNEP